LVAPPCEHSCHSEHGLELAARNHRCIVPSPSPSAPSPGRLQIIPPRRVELPDYPLNSEGCYGWVERVLIGQRYAQQGKQSRGLLRCYIEKMALMQ
jgi:hypothetical protein